MRRIVATAALVLASTSLTGCFSAGLSTVQTGVPGLLFAQTTTPEGVSANPRGSKTGTATCTSILGLIAEGDCSITAAAKQGNITRIATVDRSVKNILSLYAQVTITVTGE